MRRFLLVILSAFACVFAAAQNEESGVSSANGLAAGDYLTVYQKGLSPLKNTHCRMYPSCSAYARLAFSHNDPATAFLLTADRLTRCGHDPSLYPHVVMDGKLYAVDFPEGVKTPQELLQRKSTVGAETIIVKDTVDSAIQFVSHLINNANYYGALAQIECLLYFSPQIYSDNVLLQVSRLKSYEGLRDYSKGVLVYHSLPDYLKANYKVRFEASHLMALSGDETGAMESFWNCAESYKPESDGISPYGELAILYLKGGQYDISLEMLEKRAAVEANYPSLLQSRDVVVQTRDARRKNPALARALSIIPGAGYLYAGSPSNALTSLLVNCLLGYATYTSFRSGNDGLGIILGGLSLSFYLGNSFGAASLALRHNERILEQGVRKLEMLNPHIN